MNDTTVRSRRARTRQLLENLESRLLLAAVPVTLTSEDLSAAEADPNFPEMAVLHFARAQEANTPLTINFTRTGTAVAADYALRVGSPNGAVLTKNSVVIPGGQGSVDIYLVPVDDAIVEGAETATFTLAANAAYTFNPEAAGLTVTIADNEPTVTAAVDTANASETDGAGAGVGVVVFTRDSNMDAALVVKFTRGGTAGATDYTLHYGAADGAVIGAANAITILPGDASATVYVVPTDDALVEAAETVILTTATAAGYTVAQPVVGATVTIADNEPTVSISSEDVAAESGTPAEDTAAFTITREGNTDLPLTVTFARGGTAATGADYTLRLNDNARTLVAGNTVTIPAGASSVDLIMTPVDDLIVEPTETVTLTLATGNSYTLNVEAAAATMGLLDNEPTVSITAADDGGVSESGTPAEETMAYSITRDTLTGKPLVVPFTRGGTATTVKDYVLHLNAADGPVITANSVTIPADDFSVTVVLVPVDDAIVEPTETVVLTLVPGTAFRADGAAGAVTTSILDNEATVSVTVEEGAFTAESGTPALATADFTITRDRNIDGPLTVVFTRGGTATTVKDYVLKDANGAIVTKNSVVIPAGESSVTLTLVPVDDVLQESTETMLLTLAASTAYTVSGDTGAATLTIVDNEPNISVVATKPAASETNNGTTTGVGVFTFTRTGVATAALDVTYTLTGTAVGDDYAPVSGTAHFEAGKLTTTLNIVPVNDLLGEGTESVIVNLTAGEGALYTLSPQKSQATVLIADNEPVVSIVATKGTALELNGTTSGAAGLFTLTRTGPTTAPLTVTVNYSGTAGDGDVVAVPSTVTFLAGKATATLAVNAVDDLVTEGDETVVAQIVTDEGQTYGVSDTKGQATVTIKDHNRAPTAGPGVVSGARTGLPYTILFDQLLEATGASDPEGGPVTFKITAVKSGTLTKNGVAVVPNTTVIGPEETLVWTPKTNTNGTFAAFTVVVSDGVNVSAPVTVSVLVSPPTS